MDRASRAGGYVTDVPFPAFFYREMQPLWLATVAGFQGFAAPDVARPFALCELGCGTGTNLLVAAACHPAARFVGVDLNAAHVETARRAAATGGIDNVAFIHADFASFAAGPDEPFDFVTCHGVWSWIAAADRGRVIDIAARCLVPGGLLYLHYMCHPGSTELAPLQFLMKQCADHMPGPSTRQAQIGLTLLQRIAATGGFANAEAVRRHLAIMASRDPADLAHEFLTDHWRPQHSADVHQQGGRAGLSFIGSAAVFDNLDVSLSIPRAMQPLLRQTTVQALAETLKDIARHAHQRMDLFQKDTRPLAGDAAAAVGSIRIRALPGVPTPGAVTFDTPIGPITGAAAIFAPLLARLAQGPAAIAELAQLPPFANDPGAVLPPVQLLMMRGAAHPVLASPPSTAVRADALARVFADRGVPLVPLADAATAVPAS